MYVYIYENILPQIILILYNMYSVTDMPIKNMPLAMHRD